MAPAQDTDDTTTDDMAEAPHDVSPDTPRPASRRKATKSGGKTNRTDAKVVDAFQAADNWDDDDLREFKLPHGLIKQIEAYHNTRFPDNPRAVARYRSAAVLIRGGLAMEANAEAPESLEATEARLTKAAAAIAGKAARKR